MVALVDLIVTETKQAIYERALSVATTLGLPVTTWEAGDPTRSLYHVLSETLYNLEVIAARYVASGFLDLAADLDDLTWLQTLASQVYGYTAREATYATCTVRLTNSGAGVYTPDALDLVFALTADPDITYRNTTGGTLGASSTLDVTVECTLSGTQGSASIGDIELVTSLPGVTASNTTAATGQDAESAESIVAGCRAKLASLSPNGAADAYEYVALSQTLTGAGDVTRCQVVAESTTGAVTVYLASSGGVAAAGDVTLVETAIVTYATPLTITPTVQSAVAKAINVTAAVKVYDTVGETAGDVEDGIEDAIRAMLATVPVGGDGADGKLYLSSIYEAIMQAYPDHVFGVTLTVPASDTTIGDGYVATEGALSITVTLEAAA